MPQSTIPTVRAFVVTQSTRAKVPGYSVSFVENSRTMFTNFFPSEEVEHQGQSFDLGFEKACHIGQAFILGGGGDEQ